MRIPAEMVDWRHNWYCTAATQNAKMVKITTISRNEKDFTRTSKLEPLKVFRNPDPKLHPFERAREYTRALNAVKLDRHFAKPFLASLDGHADGVHSLALSPTNLVLFASGACDGDIRFWDVARRRTLWHVKAHQGFVRGLVFTNTSERVLSCGVDKTIKTWKAQASSKADIKPLHTITASQPFSSIDHHRTQDLFATCSTQVDLWSHGCTEPTHSFNWGCESIRCVRFNPVETQVLASTGSDRNIVLYDVRTRSPMRKVVLQMASNDVCWNPMEAFNFTVANEDSCCYTFDMRNLTTALTVHKDHVGAVMSVDYAPTGKEIVTGSYDRTVRVFGVTQGRSRDVYHTKRMQRVMTVRWTLDNTYILSGSDETNIRLWKARASERLGTLLPRQRRKRDYEQKIMERHAHAPEIRRIARHRHVPKVIKTMRATRHTMMVSEKKKEERRRKHQAATVGATPRPKERQKKIVKELE